MRLALLILPALLLACAPPEPEPPPPEPCVYPEATVPFNGVGDVPPPLKWRGYEDHQPIEVDLEAFYCGDLWPEYSSIAFILVAEWCPECPDYSRFLGTIAEELEFNGAKLVFVDMETRDFALPTSESADNYVSQYTEFGVRVGEADNDPEGFITKAEDDGLWQATPNAFFVRKSDMQVVTRQQDGTFILPFIKIAQGIDLDWSNPDEVPFVDNCTADEASEPNDDVTQLSILTAGTVEGGICNSEPDIFRVEVEGSWRLTLDFTHFTANLDIFMLDEVGEIQRFSNGDPFGAFTEDDGETLFGNGPQNIMIVADDDRSAPYTLTVEPL